MAKRTQTKSAKPRRNVVPDRLDLRDRPYMPSVAIRPEASMAPMDATLPMLNQKQTKACTGFALATVMNFLRRRHFKDKEQVSAFMIYSMAQRYDEFPDSKKDADPGSSCRGAMKGWFKHGACRLELWDHPKMPNPSTRPQDDWWLDAVNRPLGAYYRVNTRAVTDMHVALKEVGILYASAVCHSGWDKGFEARQTKNAYWKIPSVVAAPDDGGHAFAIVGYTAEGFIVQNSWGIDWGSRGLAILPYEDWIENAMDCWVAQSGVVTSQHLEIAASSSLRVSHGKVQIAGSRVLRDREIAPFIIDMENNGKLSTTGAFRTQLADVQALVTLHVDKAKEHWGLKDSDPIDVAIYAHGGLTSEEDAADTAAAWIPALYDNKIFPIILMWETDLWSTLKNRFTDLVSGLPKPTAGLADQLQRFWNKRLEKMLAMPGSEIWGEMKQNGDAITGAADSGGRILHKCADQAGWAGKKNKVRLHLIGHSAGAIVHSHLVHRLGSAGWMFESVNFMAPAVRMDVFKDNVLPKIKDGTVKKFRTFHLTDTAEQQDPTCRPILGYRRSLLYLVSESFENGVRTPILGMEKFFNAEIPKLASIEVNTAPSSSTASTTHGGFDDDKATRSTIIAAIKS